VRLFGALMVFFLSSLAEATPLSRLDCFPIEKLPVALQKTATEILQRSLDTEGLYTLVGDIKPASNFLEFHVDYSLPKESSKRRAQEKQRASIKKILPALRCGGDLETVILSFKNRHENSQHYGLVNVNVKELKKKVAEHADFFKSIGWNGKIGEGFSSHEIVRLVENASHFDRYRGYGLIFGYPEYAVNFFVEAAKSQAQTGKLVAREFITVPVFERSGRLFVWVTPVGYQAGPIDEDILERARPILAAYRIKRRKVMRDDSRYTVMDLIRDFYATSDTEVDPHRAVELIEKCELLLRGKKPKTDRE